VPPGQNLHPREVEWAQHCWAEGHLCLQVALLLPSALLQAAKELQGLSKDLWKRLERKVGLNEVKQ